MKAALLVAILAAGSATGQVLRTIDPNQHVEANDKFVGMPTVNFGTVPQPTRSQTVSPLSNQMRERAGNVETKYVDAPKTLSYSTVPTTTLTRQNFVPKRSVAELPDKVAPAKNIEEPTATVPTMVIRPLSPTGQDELKKQLATPH
jgi:hypothetical protein